MNDEASGTLAIHLDRCTVVHMDADTYRETVAAELRADIARERVSYVTLAQRTGIPVRSLARRVNGEAPITVEDLALIAAALGSTPQRYLPQLAVKS